MEYRKQKPTTKNAVGHVGRAVASDRVIIRTSVFVRPIRLPTVSERGNRLGSGGNMSNGCHYVRIRYARRVPGTEGHWGQGKKSGSKFKASKSGATMAVCETESTAEVCLTSIKRLRQS